MFKLILRYLEGPARACAIAAPLAMLLEVAMDLQQPSLMARIIDLGVAHGDGAYVLGTGLLMLAMALAGFAGGASCSLLATKASVDMGGRMRQGLFDKAQSLSCAEVDGLRTSSLVTRCTNDVMQVQGMVRMMLAGMVRTPLLLFGSIAMAYALSPSLSTVFWFALPIVIGSIAAVLGSSSKAFARVQSCLDKVNTIMRENLLGIRVTKALSLERRQAERFEVANEELTGASIRAQDLTFVLLPVVTFAMNACVVAVLWFGGGMAKSGELEIGKIMAFINYLVQIANSTMMAANLIVWVSRSSASASRIGEVLAMENSLEAATARVPIMKPAHAPGSAAGAMPDGYAIEFRDVCFSYGRGAESALSGISFKAEEGQRIGIIGATGSGKSSLASLVPRLYDPSSGQVLLGGLDLRSWDLPELRRRVCMTTQESLIFAGSVASNLRMGREDASEREMEDALRAAQAYDFVSALPEGIRSCTEQRGRNLSGGQRQRISIARALLRDARILVLDDATSAVDLRTESRLRSSMAAPIKGRTVITIAQRISAIMGSDTIIVLDFGRIAAMGRHSELLRSSDIYRDIALSQLGQEALEDA